MKLKKWLETYNRAPEEGEKRVIARCKCEKVGYNPKGTCNGWVLTHRDAIYPHEFPLTDRQRARVGLPADQWRHLNRGVFDGSVR